MIQVFIHIIVKIRIGISVHGVEHFTIKRIARWVFRFYKGSYFHIIVWEKDGVVIGLADGDTVIFSIVLIA